MRPFISKHLKGQHAIRRYYPVQAYQAYGTGHCPYCRLQAVVGWAYQPSATGVLSGLTLNQDQGHMDKVGGKRNYGYGKQLIWATKNALSDHYGHGKFSTRASHAERWNQFVNLII